MSAAEVTIRDANPDDVAALVEMGRRFHGESRWAAVSPFKADDFALSLTRLMSQDNGAVVVSPRGFGCAVMGPSLHDHGLIVMQDFILWRDGRLLAALEDRARHQGAGAFLMSAQRTHRPAAMARWLWRQGYSELETVYVKPLKTAQLEA